MNARTLGEDDRRRMIWKHDLGRTHRSDVNGLGANV